MQKKLIYILLLISLFSLTFGCQTESYDFGREDGSIEVLEDGRLRVPILLHIPEREVVETKSAPSDAEKAVNTVDVCVFDASGNRLEKVSGVIDPSNPLRVFAKVLPRNVACQVQVYVNIPARCRVAFNAADNKAKIDTLTMSNVIFKNDSITKNGLPMVSELKEYDKLNKTTLENQVANLKFAYARIDVNAKDIKGQFTLEKAYVFNAANKGYVIKPESLPIDDITKSPSDSINVDETTNNINGIYVFENNGALYNQEQGSNPTDLIIKGKNGELDKGYYKIRIAYGTNKATYDIRRGVRYAVKITRVKGPGYLTKEEAEKHEPSNVEYDITVNDGSSKDVVISNGSYYLGVSNSEFIVCADNAYGVTATTLSHNAPGSVSTATIQVNGTGITLSPNQQGLTVSQDGKSATINLQTPRVPIKVNLTTDVIEPCTLTIRIGDLVKEIKVVKEELISQSKQVDINLKSWGLSDCSVVESQSPRIVVNSNTSLTVKPESGPSTRVLSTVKAFSASRGNVVIAVKRKVQNVVYYEKYSDSSIGLYLDKSKESTIKSESIIEAGYAIVNTEQAQQALFVKIGQLSPKSYSGVYRDDLFEDYRGSIYFMNQNTLSTFSESLTAGLVQVGPTTSSLTTTNSYIYPNFAKGVYSSDKVTDGNASTPFSIRTPKQFRNINAMAANSSSRFFKQERDLNFADLNVGGDSSFATAIIVNEFKGNYDGAGKGIRNLTLNNINQSMALFHTNSGSIRDLRLYKINVTGGSSTSCLVGSNKGTIETILIDQSKVIGHGQFTGGIAGHNLANGYINNCMIKLNTALDGNFIYSYWTKDNKILVGSVCGCNHSDSKGIENICVIDVNPDMVNKIVDTYYRYYPSLNSRMNYAGGVVGKNAKMLKNILFIGKLTDDPYPYIYPNNYYYPISGIGGESDIKMPVASFYLFGSENLIYAGGGDKITSQELSDLTFNSLYWEKATWTKYPYPKLVSFDAPSSWPVRY